jgi:hypothetical protein
MQIVESGTDCYEVIWDDVPAEDDMRFRRRSSTASQALHTVGSTAARGLERVNSKLTEWTWGRKGQQQLFKPHIVVFPDQDSLAQHRGNAVDDDYDATILAPPNSQKTSANPSVLPSHNASARGSRSGSHDEGMHGFSTDASDLSDEVSSARDNVPTLVVPDPSSRPKTLTSFGPRLKPLSAIRTFSNMEEPDMNFRGHRDSVMLARSRIDDSGGISPELFMHRCSVSLAKKRMYVKNHATTEARNISRPLADNSELIVSVDDLDLPSPTDIKKHAAMALKSSSSVSMLRTQSEDAKRHIRIME